MKPFILIVLVATFAPSAFAAGPCFDMNKEASEVTDAEFQMLATSRTCRIQFVEGSIKQMKLEKVKGRVPAESVKRELSALEKRLVALKANLIAKGDSLTADETE